MLDRIIFESKSTKSFDIPYSEPMILKKILHNFSGIKALADRESRIDLLDICIDLDSAIRNCGLTEVQDRRLSLWMLGYTEKDIATGDKVRPVVVHTSIVTACKKISNKLTGTNNV